MTREKAESLLKKDYNKMNFEQLQKYKVQLLDAWRESRAEYGFAEAVKNGFYKILASESASGFVPMDLWLTQNLDARILEVEKVLNKLY